MKTRVEELIAMQRSRYIIGAGCRRVVRDCVREVASLCKKRICKEGKGGNRVIKTRTC